MAPSLWFASNPHNAAYRGKPSFTTCSPTEGQQVCLTEPSDYRMNKRLSNELDSAVVERRGWFWDMTSFGVDAYKASEKDLLSEGLALYSVSKEES
jgi:hypothetical protein